SVVHEDDFVALGELPQHRRQAVVQRQNGPLFVVDRDDDGQHAANLMITRNLLMPKEKSPACNGLQEAGFVKIKDSHRCRFPKTRRTLRGPRPYPRKAPNSRSETAATSSP